MAVDSRFTEDERKAINTVLLTLEAERANRGCTFPVPAIATVRAMLESPDPSRRAAVDVDAVMEAIKQYQESVEERQRAIYTHRFQYAGALREEQQDRLAAIRALLEPHDAARLDVVTIPRELAERALEAFESISEISAVSSRHKYQCAADANSMKGFLR